MSGLRDRRRPSVRHSSPSGPGHDGEDDAAKAGRRRSGWVADWTGPIPAWPVADGGSELEATAADSSPSVDGAHLRRPAEPRHSRIPGWLRAILFMPAEATPMAHRDPHLADLGRQMARPQPPRQGAVAASVTAFLPARFRATPSIGALPLARANPRLPGSRRRFAAGEQRRREAGMVLALLAVASIISVGGPFVSVGSSAEPTPLYTLIGESDPTAPPPTPSDTATPIGPNGTNALDPTFLPVPTATPTRKPTTARVRTFVALGDSLTAWPSYNPWPSRLDAADPYLRLVHNAGVPGNTTAQMRSRLRTDVYPYKPDILFVLGGTNDLGMGISQSAIIANLRAIIVDAKAHRIRVILVNVPPDSYPSMVSRIRSLNTAIYNLAWSQGLSMANVYNSLATSAGLYYPKYTSDGLHFSDLGCQVAANAVRARMKRLGM